MNNRLALIALLLFSGQLLSAQNKKPLDHTVYDSWQNIGQHILSPDGHWIAYTVDVQEGDGSLYVTGEDTSMRVLVPRGYDASFTADSKFLVCKIRPLYADIRQARIKKKKPEDGPKDSLAILKLGLPGITKMPRVKSYRLPEKAGEWLAYQQEASDEPKTKGKDSTAKKDGYESLSKDADGDDAAAAKKPVGSDLVLRDLGSGQVQRWNGVGEYALAKQGNLLAFGVIGTKKDSLFKGYFCVWKGAGTDTVLKGGEDFRKIAIDEAGQQVVFVAGRDSAKVWAQANATHLYHLFYYKAGADTARLLLEKAFPGMKVGWTVSENGDVSFSKSGQRVLLGTAPIQPPKDTSIQETEVARLDIWTYKDDYLQPMQLKERDRELKRSYLGVFDLGLGTFAQLGDITMPTVEPSNEGDGNMFLGLSDYGKRIPLQWEGKTLKDVFAIDPVSGTATIIRKDLDGIAAVSAGGRYILWYDLKARQYSAYSPNGGIRVISNGVKKPLYDEQNDVPDDPSPYGVAGWLKADSSVWVYDRYDIWSLDPSGTRKPTCITGGQGRRQRIVYRYLQLDKEERSIDIEKDIWLHAFNDSTKAAGYALLTNAASRLNADLYGPFAVGMLVKAKDAPVFLFTRETYEQSPNLWAGADPKTAAQITSINPQQAAYNWGKATLVHWTTFKGKKADGILYMPENFDPRKKYPMITYFYERLSDGLYSYIPPAPTPSRLNISFYVSRGYLVFAPDIRYTVGHPGKSAYDYIVSGVQALTKRKYVDAANLAIQGQSWGGYPVAYLITATHLFKAAWAGAPVVNMFSAYGGIRWESGMNRQFQYEHTQSRIGATPWAKPDLYMENSPLFHLQNVTAPLVIMANDADGAVPWYQGIEMFTDMKRLGKQVWMLTYNGEAHNLVERRNRKDIQIREQQFFDWQLKGDRPARWLTEGVPATAKGRTWGLEPDNSEKQ